MLKRCNAAATLDGEALTDESCEESKEEAAEKNRLTERRTRHECLYKQEETDAVISVRAIYNVWDTEAESRHRNDGREKPEYLWRSAILTDLNPIL